MREPDKSPPGADASSAESAKEVPPQEAAAQGVAGEEVVGDDAEQPVDAAEFEDAWVAPPFQPLRALVALLFVAGGFGLYEYVLLSFWSSGAMGIHERVPYPAYAGIAAALALCIAGFRLALAIWSPHAKLGLSMLALLACVAVGVGGGRFVSYTLRGTLNPRFTLKLKEGDRFPQYSLADQSGVTRNGPPSTANATLMVVYRGDYCPFARYELAELTAHKAELARANVAVVALSTDPVERSKMLAGFLGGDIPLLSDERESILGPLGLVQHHRNGEPDNAIPAFFILDRAGVVRWIFTSPYYREMPALATLLDAAASIQGK